MTLFYSQNIGCLAAMKISTKNNDIKVDVCTTPSREINDYVLKKDQGRLCHLPEWGLMIEKTFGHRFNYLVARKKNLICGVLPLSQVKSKLFGNRLISQAFSNYGGPLVNDANALVELMYRAFKLVQEYNCSFIEFRNIEPLNYNLSLQNDKVCMILPLVSNPDIMWKSLRPEIRNRVRKAKKSGLIAISGGLEFLEEFYQIWCVRMHQLGTPCYPKGLFKAIFQTFPDQSKIFLVRLGQHTLGAMFTYSFNGLAQCRWAATSLKNNRIAPNTLLYWSAINYYCLNEMKSFDFGRSTINSSQYEFKRRWKSQPVRLNYQYWMLPKKTLSVARPDSPKYKNRVEVWKKMPLWLTKILGPHLSCKLP